MASKKKIADSSFIDSFSDYLKDYREGLSKSTPWEFAIALKKGLGQIELKETYLQKYKTIDLVALFDSMLKKRVNKKEFQAMLSMVNIFYKRGRIFDNCSCNNRDVTPLIIDEILFSSTQITNVKGTNDFSIINWNQLHIELREKYLDRIVFYKVIDGRPSNQSVIKKSLKKIHLGLATREIIKNFGYLKTNEAYKHPLAKKDQVYRLNKALKLLFKMPENDNPFYWNKNMLKTKVSITAFDKKDLPVTLFNLH